MDRSVKLAGLVAGTWLAACLFQGTAARAEPDAMQRAPGEAAAAAATNPIDYATARFERVVHALRIDEPITIDGKLTEDAWQRAGRPAISCSGIHTRASRRPRTPT